MLTGTQQCQCHERQHRQSSWTAHVLASGSKRVNPIFIRRLHRNYGKNSYKNDDADAGDMNDMNGNDVDHTNHDGEDGDDEDAQKTRMLARTTPSRHNTQPNDSDTGYRQMQVNTTRNVRSNDGDNALRYSPSSTPVSSCLLRMHGIPRGGEQMRQLTHA
jgi:hypothetical protein